MRVIYGTEEDAALLREEERIRGAVAEERERCAKIADQFAMSDDETESATAEDIAAAIRRG